MAFSKPRSDAKGPAHPPIRHIERYKDFFIRVTSIDPGRWQSEICKADGSALMIPIPGIGFRPSRHTPVLGITPEVAIKLAKEAIGTQSAPRVAKPKATPGVPDSNA